MKKLILLAVTAQLAASPLLNAATASASAALFSTVRAGDLAAIQAQLSSGADVNARDDAGNTPLIVAAFCADADVVRLLLQSGADVKAANQAGVTALLRAATFRDNVRLLVEAGADVNARSAIGNTALMLAARQHGNAATVKLLLDRGAPVNATNLFGASALMAAVAAEDLETTRLLLDRGAAVNTVPAMSEEGFLWGGGRTALSWAAFRNNESLVKLLLAHGARVDDLAITGSALTQAGWAGHADVARLLLAAGAPVDQRDLMAHYTPLHWAASSEYRDTALTKLLLDHGADVNAEGGQPVDGFLGATYTPIQLALKRGDTPIARLLRKAGAHPVSAPPAKSLPRAVRPTADANDDATIAAAIQLALPPLQQTAFESPVTFQRHASKQACISCHQQSLPLGAISIARTRRFAVDETILGETTGRTETFAGLLQEFDLQTLFHPEPAIGNGYALWSLRLAGHPASAFTDSLVHQLAVIQRADGSWAWNLPRPPIQASDIGATALAVRGLRDYPIPGRQKEFDQRIERARKWLAKARPQFTEERAYQLLGLAWAGERAAKLKSQAGALIREQRADGGWAQLPSLESDAFATGQSLYALVAGAQLPASHPAVRKGVRFLLRSQLEDGTWHAHRRAFPFQPPMDSGFPHGADGWLSAAASSWAVMTLAMVVDTSNVPAAQLAQLKPYKNGKVDPTPADSRTATGSRNIDASESLEFVRDIQPLLERSCLACHGGERPKGGFVMVDRASLLKGGNRGEPVVAPGQPEASLLMQVVQDELEDLEMPPVAKRGKFPALTKDEIGKLNGWIAQGAAWPEGVTLQAAGTERR